MKLGRRSRIGKCAHSSRSARSIRPGIKQIVVPVEGESGQVLGAVVLEYTPLYNEFMQLDEPDDPPSGFGRVWQRR